MLNATEHGNWTYDFQAAVITLVICEPDFYFNHSDCLKPEIFQDEGLSELLRAYQAHYLEYKTVPKGPVLTELIERSGCDSNELMASLDPGSKKFISDEIVHFARSSYIKEAVIKTIDHSEESDGRIDTDYIGKLFKDALGIGAKSEGLGTLLTPEYVKAEMGNTFKKARKPISTGIEQYDAVLAGGLGIGEMGIVEGEFKSGKTLDLCFKALSALAQRKNVIYYTCESTSKLIETRMFMMGTQLSEIEIQHKPAYAFQLWESFLEKGPEGRPPGQMCIKALPKDSSSILDIMRHTDALEATLNWSPDIIFIDYGDIMSPPPGKKFSREAGADSRAKYAAILGLAKERGIPVWTASQINREGKTAGAYEKNAMAHCVFKIFNVKNKREKIVEVAANRDGASGSKFRMMYHHKTLTPYIIETCREDSEIKELRGR